MRFARIYDRFSIVMVFVLALSFYGGAIALAGEADTSQGSTTTYTTNGGLGEGYVPGPHKQRTYPKYSDSYGDEEEPAKAAVKSTTVEGSTVIYTTGGGLGEGYVPHKHKKRTYPKYSEPSEENKKPVKSTVIFTTSEGKKVKAAPGSIAPGWQPSSEDHSLDFLKNFFHKILPPSKEGVAEKRAGEVGDSVIGEEEKGRAPATVITTTGGGKAEGAVLNGGIAPGWQPSGDHPVKNFFKRIWPGGEKATEGKVKKDTAVTSPAAPAAATAPKISGGTAVTPDKSLSERRSGRSYKTPAAGAALDSEDVKVPDEAPVAVEDDEYLDSDDEFADIYEEEGQAVADPIEGFNRAMFVVNDKLYFWFFRPVALGYSRVVPEPGRVAVRRFFDNVFTPVRFANNLFQLKFKNAGIEIERFVINTTIGVAGFMDPARSHWNLEMHDEDFGQTLGYYGMGPGLYINLPVFGPSNVRDTIGMVADIFLSPTAYIPPNDREIVVGINAFERLNEVSLDIGLYEDIKRDALDPYIFIRNAYQQHRESLIKE